MTKIALVTGITGQDGAYLSKFLLEKGYKVFGTYRRAASLNLWRLNELGIENDIQLIPFDLLDFINIFRTIESIQPDEIYNLAAQSFVKISFEQPLLTNEVNAMGVTRILESIRSLNKNIKYYQASTSEMFGEVREIPQSESTPFYPRSPYGVGKVFAHWITLNYRESYRLHAVNGICFNHESPLRGVEFVTRKITSSLAKIKLGSQDILELGNLNAKRDWGYAGDYVEGMWMMLQNKYAEDFVLATGKEHSVRDFVNLAAELSGYQLEWDGENESECGRDKKSRKIIVRVNSDYYRPAEVDKLIGDARKAAQILGWKPKIAFEQLVEMMVKADFDRVERGLVLF